MSSMHDKCFPNESKDYRKFRDALLKEEIALRKILEDVATLRRKLPLGGRLKEDYIFDEVVAELGNTSEIVQTTFSSLFDENKDNLLIYNFMFSADAETPCPACNSIIDGLNGSAPHIRDRVNFVVIAKAPIEKFRSWAQNRGWHNLRLLSSLNNTYNRDYFGESEDGSQQMPVMNVFRLTGEGINHTYSTELLFTATAEHQHPRHADLFWPIWNLFDLTSEGRGEDWFPKYSYD